MGMNFQPSCECIRLIFLELFAVSISSSMLFLLVITFASYNVKFHMTEASLTKFNLTSNNALDYKLEANIISRNPNKNVEISYFFIKKFAIAWYEETRLGIYKDFAIVNLSSFDHGHKNTTFLNAAFEGNGAIKLKPKELFEYSEEMCLGIYNESFFDFFDFFDF